jgi:hypothetical protein
MDEIARRYLLLGLRLERHVPGFVDSYVGPPELAEVVVAEEPVAAMALHDEALRLQELAAELPADEPGQERRRAWFGPQLRAVGALARQAAGEEIGFVDLVEQLFDVRVAAPAEERLAAARARLDEVLPGSGPLTERYRSFTEQLQVPAEKTVDVARASVERFRAVARRDFDVPQDEAIEWGETHDQAWNAQATFLGNGRTRIELNLDLPRDIVTIARLAAHEGYPGHHLDNITKERTLIRDAALGEAALRTLATPELVLAEGLASVAREVVMSDLELAAELRRIAADAGLAPGGLPDIAALVASPVLELHGAYANAALMLHDQGLPTDAVRDYLLETTIQPAATIDHAMRALQDPFGRTYEFSYSEGIRIVRAWLEVQGQTAGFARLLAEQLTPSRLVAEAASDAA